MLDVYGACASSKGCTGCCTGDQLSLSLCFATKIALLARLGACWSVNGLGNREHDSAAAEKAVSEFHSQMVLCAHCRAHQACFLLLPAFKDLWTLTLQHAAVHLALQKPSTSEARQHSSQYAQTAFVWQFALAFCPCSGDVGTRARRTCRSARPDFVHSLKSTPPSPYLCFFILIFVGFPPLCTPYWRRRVP